MQKADAKRAKQGVPTRARLQAMREEATQRSREVGDQRDLAMAQSGRLREVALMGVCPECHTAEGRRALKRAAGYLGEFTMDMDCNHPYHALRRVAE